MVELVDGLPSKLETLQNKISKNGTLSHGCINLVINIVDLSHVSISERVYYSYCSRDNIFVRLYDCSDCDLNINKIWKQFQLKTNRIDKRVRVSSYEKNTNDRISRSIFTVVSLLPVFIYLFDLIHHKSTSWVPHISINSTVLIYSISINQS